MLPCKTMWNNIIWLMIFQKRSAPNAVSNPFTLQKHPRWWSHPLYPWRTLVERGSLLCRNIPGGGHIHSIHEGPWLRGEVYSAETPQVVVAPTLSMKDLGWERQFTLQKHPRWWSHPLYPWRTLVERGSSLCRNILDGGHIHSIHERPWLREVVYSAEIS